MLNVKPKELGSQNFCSQDLLSFRLSSFFNSSSKIMIYAQAKIDKSLEEAER